MSTFIISWSQIFFKLQFSASHQNAIFNTLYTVVYYLQNRVNFNILKITVALIPHRISPLKCDMLFGRILMLTKI